MSSRTRQILIGIVPIICVSVAYLASTMLGHLPGFPGELFRKISGIMFTPFFLEFSVAFLGIMAVFCVNNIRLQREGDDYREIEIEEDESDSTS